MSEALGVVATCLAVAGVLANNRRLRWCFYAWLFSNSLTLTIHVSAGIWSLAARDMIFLALAVEGLWRWRK